MVQLFVDADACPVKDEVIRVAERYDLQVIMVADGGLRPSRNPLVRNHIVSQGADAADDWIAENISREDICVTADIPLAARCLAKGARVVPPNGRPFTEANIGNLAISWRTFDLDRIFCSQILSIFFPTGLVIYA